MAAHSAMSVYRPVGQYIPRGSLVIPWAHIFMLRNIRNRAQVELTKYYVWNSVAERWSASRLSHIEGIKWAIRETIKEDEWVYPR